MHDWFGSNPARTVKIRSINALHSLINATSGLDESGWTLSFYEWEGANMQLGLLIPDENLSLDQPTHRALG